MHTFQGFSDTWMHWIVEMADVRQDFVVLVKGHHLVVSVYSKKV